MRLRTGLLIVLGLGVAACGPSTTSDTTTDRQSLPSTSATDPVTETTSVVEPPSSQVPGEAVDFGPQSGDRLMVIGIPYDDGLALQALPGRDGDVLDEVGPTSMALIAGGETRQLPASFWTVVEHEGISGWVDLRFVGYEGVTDDVTSAVVESLGGIPVTDSMLELGLVAASTISSEDPEAEIVLVVDETVGDLGEVTFDIVGLADDAVRGLRLHVFGEPTEGRFSLKSVEMTTICGRGVTEDGLCI